MTHFYYTNLYSSELNSFYEDYLPLFEAKYSFHYLLLDRTFLVFLDSRINEEEQLIGITVITDYYPLIKIFKNDFPWKGGDQLLDNQEGFNTSDDEPLLMHEYSERLIFGGSRGQTAQVG